MNRKSQVLVVASIFALGAAVGYAAKKTNVPSSYLGVEPKAASGALLALAQEAAEDGSWEHLGVARVVYLSGDKAAGQAMIDKWTGPKAEGGEWIRAGRIYWEAGDWDQAKRAFDKVIQLEPKDADWLAEIGCYYMLKGDRAKAEELFSRSFALEPRAVWNLLRAASAYAGIEPPA